MKIRNLLILSLAVVLAAPAFQSCKKGENDPFISLKSRKARLKGDWKLTAKSVTELDGTDVTTYSYNGSTMTESSAGQVFSYPYSETLTIETDGTFTGTMTTTSGNTMSITTVKGIWWFGKKNKEAEYKNGEVVVFQITSVTSSGSSQTFTGSNCPTYTILIDQLKSKEMVIIEDGSNAYSGGISSSTGTSTYEK